MQEQLRLRGIEVVLDLCADELVVFGNPIQLEQVFVNLLTNARDALEDARTKRIWIETTRDEELITIRFSDSGPGIQRELEQRGGQLDAEGVREPAGRGPRVLLTCGQQTAGVLGRGPPGRARHRGRRRVGLLRHGAGAGAQTARTWRPSC